MLSINTNLSSQIVQQSMANATKLLNLSIEQMTTGYKINHAKDNAANYSISTNLTTRISAYQVAEDNTLQGLDLLTTASDSLSQIEDKLIRLRALQTQATNGTYGASSLRAINTEANSIIDEIQRLYKTASYNGINLFTNATSTDSSMPVAGSNGFIAEVVKDTPEVTVTDPTKLAEAIANNTIIGISNAETLAELATIVNDGEDCSGKTIVLTNDIDLGAWCEAHKDEGGWEPINYFEGAFNGNGYVISNLYINRPTENCQGLFNYLYYNEIKNLGMTNVDITGAIGVGAIIGTGEGEIMTNCFMSGEVTGTGDTGGLVGCSCYGSITNSYTVGKITGSMTGGLAGYLDDNEIMNCFSLCDVFSSNTAGGLIGEVYGCISNCYTTGDVVSTGKYSTAGGLVGSAYSDITNCYATGDVVGNRFTGGLVGYSYGSIYNSYATGDVIGTFAEIKNNCATGGLVGRAYSDITNCYATGNVIGSDNVGGLFGNALENGDITNSYATGKVSGETNVGALAGKFDDDVGYWGTINNCTYYSLVNSGISAIGSANGVDLSGIIDGGRPAFMVNIGLQVGVNSNDSSRLGVDTWFQMKKLDDLRDIGLNTSKDYLSTIDNLLSTVSAKQTEYGAAQNRLMSALEEISVQYDNLVSSRSTLRDADIAEVSSTYIQQQILQQASATLLATANQSAGIALQLL